jgi:para-nitrobenzyl esterase
MNLLDHRVLTNQSRRSFMIRASSLLATPALFNIGRNAWADTVETGKTAVVKTTYGQLRGVGENGVFTFKGIPYAGPSDGPNRFQPPTKLQPWTGIRDAVQYGPQAFQQGNANSKSGPASSENCQLINIWTPSVDSGAKKPVMFYLHGGGFIGGSGGSGKNPMHDGSALSRNNDVVVVTSNHRLGVMGYLYLGDLSKKYPASGIAGMLDIVASLQWTRDNIASFGGDPDNVFIFGESGGGQKVVALLAMPSANGLFHKASVESAPSMHMNDRAISTKTTEQVMAQLGLSTSQVDELVNVPPARLIEAQAVVRSKSVDMEGTLGYFGPVVDGHYLPHHPYDPVGPAISKGIPLIVGSNKQEGLLRLQEEPETFKIDEAGLKAHIQHRLGDKEGLQMYSLYRKNRPDASPIDVYVDFLTHQWMWVDTTRRLERQLALHGNVPVYTYIFDYESEVPLTADISYPRKAIHGIEIAYKFDHPENDPATGKRPERFQAAKNMSRAWATFARTGDPSHSEIPKWPAYTVEQRATMILNATCTVVNDPMRDERLAWLKVPDKIGAKPHFQGGGSD